MLNGVLLLLTIPLLLRVAMGRDREQGWSSGQDLPIAAVAGLFYAWACLELAPQIAH